MSRRWDRVPRGGLLEEGIQLRKGGIVIPMFVLNYFDPPYVMEAVNYDLPLNVHQL